MAGGLKERERQGFYDPTDQDGLSPAKQAYDDNVDASLRNKEAGDDLSDREAATSNAIGDKLADNSSSLNEKENNSAGLYEQSSSRNHNKQPLKAFFTKKRLIGGIGALIGGGGIITLLLSPTSMLASLHDNLIFGNDSASSAMERRLHRVLKNASEDSSTLCGKSKKINCHMGRMSNYSLRQMAKRGIKPIFNDSEGAASHKDIKRTGYPDRNPASYEIDDNGTKRIVKAGELMDFLQKKENRRLASKVLGVGGAFNMRFRAWTGKHIKGRFYEKFKLSRSGAFMKNIKSQAGDKTKTKLGGIFEKIAAEAKAKFPGAEVAAERFKGHIGQYTSKMKKGGAGYMLLASGCMISKAPKLVGAGVAAYQLSQILGPVMNIILNNGSRMKAAGFGGDFSSEDMSIIGDMLTEKTPNEKGKKTSALDSKYLLAALGVNKGKLPVSSKFAPGFSTITNPAIRQGAAIGEALEGPCNVIMSPAAIYSAAAADAALTIAASSAPLVGTIAKIVISYAVSELLGAVIEKVGGYIAKQAFEAFAANNAIPTARGEELGDVLGIGAAAFFSSGAMSRSLPALTVNGAQAFHQMKQDTARLQKEMDIASLSPLDMSSPYTFLGNIASTLQQNLLRFGTYSSPIRSAPLLPIAILGSALSPTATNAAMNFSNDYCGYAKDFQLEGVNGNNPAINMAGLPCTGLTRSQDSMSTSEAISLMIGEGWLDESKDIEPGDSIQDLIDKSYIKPDTPLYDFIDSCSDASTGNYIFNAAGCVIDDSEQLSGDKLRSVTNQIPKSCSTRDDGTEVCFNGTIDGAEENPAGLNNPRAMAAISVFLLDYQIVQSINGEDEQEYGSSSASATPGAAELDQAQQGWGGYSNGEIPADQLSAIAFSPSDRMQKDAARALEAMNQAYNHETGSNFIINEAYRDCATQKAYDDPSSPLYQGGRAYPARSLGCGSNHGWGLAVDLEVGDFGSPTYQWLSANASRFGFVNPPWAQAGGSKPESWHWEYARRVE